MTVIDASDLSTVEVRSQYVDPLLHKLLVKSSLIDFATALGAESMRCEIDGQLASVDKGRVSTLFQEIVTQYPSTRRHLDQDGAAISEKDENIVNSECSVESYADLLEAASAVFVYMKPQEKAVVATIASSCLLSYLVPQMCVRGFLRSYFTSSETSSSTLEQRITKAAVSSNHQTSGGVFPYSAARMRSLAVDDDGFTSSCFHTFLQGMRSFLSCGALDFPSKHSESNNNSFDSEGVSYHSILFRAGVDLIQLLAMAICPIPQTNTPKALSLDADKSARGEHDALDSVKQLVHSTIPFSFQLSYSDRLELVSLCTDLFIPEREDSGLRNAIFHAALRQLRSALFCFASFNAHSDKDVKLSFQALANVAINQGEVSIQFEFERLLKASIESTSTFDVAAIGDCLVSLVARYNGSRYYADGEFVQFALGLLGDCIHDRIGYELTNKAQILMSENVTKRQKTEITFTTKWKPTACHLIAFIKVGQTLLYFLLNNGATKKAEGKDVAEFEDAAEDAETVAKHQMMRDVTLLLCYTSDLSVVQSASHLLALALSYDEKFAAAKINVKYLFRFTRQALDTASESVHVVRALRPLIIEASRQSRTFAESLVSYAVKTCNNRMKWKIANLIASACPLVVSNRLAELAEGSQDTDEFCRDTACDQIITRLSCTMASYTSASSETIKRCLSLADGVTNRWTLYRLVRYSFATGSFGFAHQILSQQRLERNCTQQRHFLWLTILSRIAQAGVRKNGAVDISESLEILNSCHSTLQSLATIEQDNQGTNVFDTANVGKLGFQLDFLAAKIDFLDLCMITRSLCSESMVTGGDISARSKRRLINLPKCFGMLSSRCNTIYRLNGLHFCQQTRCVLRNLIDMCQFMQESVLLFKSESGPKQPQQGVTQDCLPKSYIGSLLVHLRAVRAKKSMNSLLLWELLGTLLGCPMPFPTGFFRVKSVPFSFVNISADTKLFPTKQNDDVEVDGSGKYIEVTPGLPFKLILNGIISDEFIWSADVQFNQVIAWLKTVYLRPLYEDDDVKIMHSERSSSNHTHPPSPTFSSSLQPCGKFVLEISCQPIMREGMYKAEVKLGCRDIRCTEWSIPTMTPLEVFLRVEDYSE